MVTVEEKSVKETGVTFHPQVIEPSFGLDRIFYTLLEHSFYARADDAQVSSAAECATVGCEAVIFGNGKCDRAVAERMTMTMMETMAKEWTMMSSKS